MSSPDEIAKAVEQFCEVRPKYEELVAVMKHSLETFIAESPEKMQVTVTGRAKDPDKLKEKLERKNYPNGLDDVEDLAGVRVVCFFDNDLRLLKNLIKTKFKLVDFEDKSERLGTDKMGYQGHHHIVHLGPGFSGPYYDRLLNLKCEIQVRTITQDAWAVFSHRLVYKDEAEVPAKLMRDLNNVGAVLEVSQLVLEMLAKKRAEYSASRVLESQPSMEEFLKQKIEFDTLMAYTRYKFQKLEPSAAWTARILRDLKNNNSFKTLADIDHAVERAKDAVDAYSKQRPDFFVYGTDFISKSLGFVDEEFRKIHVWARETKQAFKDYLHLVKKK